MFLQTTDASKVDILTNRDIPCSHQEVGDSGGIAGLQGCQMADRSFSQTSGYF